MIAMGKGKESWAGGSVYRENGSTYFEIDGEVFSVGPEGASHVYIALGDTFIELKPDEMRAVAAAMIEICDRNIKPIAEETCNWEQDGDSESDLFVTGCLNSFAVTDHAEIGWLKFCPFCGGAVTVKLFDGDAD
jgi:hypothetical protein